MNQELLINVTPQETRVAVVESGVLQQIHIERACARGLVGNIYRGKVRRVLPGMQAAFVDIGLERAAFLHVSDMQTPKLLSEETGEQKPIEPTPDIRTRLHEGQSVIVQVLKDPIGSKGARLTTELALPSRYLVLLPYTQHVGVSQRIEDEGERERLKAVLAPLAEQHQLGFIVRTAGEGASEEALCHDVDYLLRLWQQIQRQMNAAGPETVVYQDLSLPVRTLRDLWAQNVERVRVDSREACQAMREFAAAFMPGLSERIELYAGEHPLFDMYGVEDEIQRALEKKVLLKSGGYLIIDQTEAMTTIDVNTGAFVGHKNLEETIFRTNLEAASALARQLRLRNLGGIIIIDFIDMNDEEHKRQVLRALEKALERDHAKTSISEVSALGLVQMTRKRTRESLEHVLCEPCPHCHGRANVKTALTVCFEIFREIIRAARAYDAQGIMVLASTAVINALQDGEANSIAELELFIGRPIKLQAEPLYAQEQFDVVLI
ncbi:ribonuclease G [Permianibacter aggregans]|uniref:ribonuclease G n=1 Tax=Permianibacter aggregans TaxID=1510150 RepID=UPI00105E46DC|nr:ribonuclease G [Permianibacter aggregans]QGX41805.1 ribonuclease G [Permianibacter aggregans]